MAVFYKLKSAKNYDSVSIDDRFITVGNFKGKIFEKHLGRGTDFDLVVTNAQTNEEYLDEATLIPQNTSVLIRRVPGWPRMPIVIAPVVAKAEPEDENKSEVIQATKSSFLGPDPSVSKYPEDAERDDDGFGDALYASPQVVPFQSSTHVQDANENSKLRALIETPTLDWQHQNSDGFRRGMGGKTGGRGQGRGFGLQRPPQGYICHRCKVPGHFIHHCPTNGNPDFDIKIVKPPTGIPRSMLMATWDGSYALPSGVAAVLKPDEAAFDKEMEWMHSTRPVGDLPPELHCPLCRKVMKDAVLTKCCFKSFCDKCIRDNFISKSICVCGATNVLADDLLPNKTLRDTISRILQSDNSSGENGSIVLQVQNMEPVKVADAAQQTMDKVTTSKVADISEATLQSRIVKEPALQFEKLQQKPISGDVGKKKKKKKASLPSAAEMHWRYAQDFALENYMMPFYNSYWTGMQPGMDSYRSPYVGPMLPYRGYGLSPTPMEIQYDYYEDASQHHHKLQSDSAAIPPITPITLDPPQKSSRVSDNKQKASVLSSISFRDEESAATKKRKVGGSSSGGDGSGHHHKDVANRYYEDNPSKGVAAAVVSRKSSSVNYEPSDEDRHFKRRPSWYHS